MRGSHASNYEKLWEPFPERAEDARLTMRKANGDVKGGRWRRNVASGRTRRAAFSMAADSHAPATATASAAGPMPLPCAAPPSRILRRLQARVPTATMTPDATRVPATAKVRPKGWRKAWGAGSKARSAAYVASAHNDAARPLAGGPQPQTPTTARPPSSRDLGGITSDAPSSSCSWGSSLRQSWPMSSFSRR